MTVPAGAIPPQRGNDGPGEEAERELLAALRAGREDLFLATVRAWWPAMVAVASRYVASRSTAEDVVQDTWVAVLRGLDRFEGRSSLRTWVFRILLNRARTTGKAERRVVPFTDAFPNGDDVADSDAGLPERASEPDAATPEDAVISAELRCELGAAVNRLPNRQRAVVLLRDVHGYPAQDVCRLLGVSSGNQRLLLHRGRAQLRTVLQGCSSR